MARSSWGGQQDLSGVFSQLINADFANIKAGIQESVRNAQNEQAAKDQHMQDRWKAGKITDEQWLDYIKTRVKDSTDPQERSQWQQILLQNQDAISDAQWETKFQQNKITVSQLMQHYRVRMGGVAHNSPAYRDLAGRMTELVQFQRSGGVHYNDQFGRSGGSGGGSGGGSTKTEVEAAKAYKKIAKTLDVGLEGGPTDIGYRGGEVYDTSGPDLFSTEFGTPAANTSASFFTSAQDGLIATQKRFEAMYQFIEDNPNAEYYTIPGTGRPIPLTPAFIRAADDQYLRATTTLAAVAEAKGDNSERDYQLGKAGSFASTTMRDHNFMAVEPALEATLSAVKQQLAVAAVEADPKRRKEQYAVAARWMDDFVTRHFPDSVAHMAARSGLQEGVEPGQEIDVNAALENMLPEDVSLSLAVTRQALDIGAHPENYTDQEVSDIFDEATAVGSLGSGASRLTPSDLWGGGTTGSSMGEGFHGVGDSRLDYMGLQNARDVESGLYSVDELPPDAPLRTYQWNPNTKRMEITEAVAQPNADGSVQIMPAVRDSYGNLGAAPNAVSFVTNVGGQSVRGYAVANASVPVSGYVYRTSQAITLKDANGRNVTFAADDLVPSSILSALGANGLRQYASSGRFYKDVLPGTKQADIGGVTWYYDQRTNTWSVRPPWNLTLDETDPNAIAVSDPDYVSNKDGAYTIDDSRYAGDTTYIAMSLNPGLPGYPIPYGNMSEKQMQQWFNGEVAAGRINPDEFMIPAPDGSDELIPLGDNFRTLYYDANMSQKAAHATNLYEGVGPDRWNSQSAADNQRAQQQRIINEWQQQNIGADQRGFWKASQADAPTNPGRMIMQQIEEFSSAMGIRTGNLTALDQVFPGARPGEQKAAMADLTNPYNNYGPGIRDFQRDALTAAVSRGAIADLPRLQPLPATPKPPIANGPSLTPPPVASPTPPISFQSHLGDLSTQQKLRQTKNFKEGL